MERQGRVPELLAPAGSFEALLAAVEAGADAVYLGGRAFGARAYAQNFDMDALAQAVRYAHLHGVKVYVTVNTLLWDRELDDAMAFCRALYRMGVDAVIAADLGLIRLLRAQLPALPVHVSTQASVHNVGGAAAFAELGAERVVVARELSIDSIREIVAHGGAEVEVFLHGALCVCHSGQCLFSSLVGGRSGNRGECAQPCRLPYNGAARYPLSLRDLSLADHVRALIDSGVASLKIEGRMKSADYVYTVTSVYRRLLDEGRCANAAEIDLLKGIFSRSGFTDGYFVGNPNAHMIGTRSDEDKELTRALAKRTFSPRRVPIFAEAHFRIGEPSSMTIFNENKRVTVYGDAPSAALTSALNAEELSTRLCKMGGTYLELSSERLRISLQDGINLSPGAINGLRRAAVDAFLCCDRPSSSEDTAAASTAPIAASNGREGALFAATGGRSAMFYDPRVADALPASTRRLFDAIFIPLWRYESGRDPVNGVALPPVITDGEWGEVRHMVERAAQSGVRYAMLENISHLSLLEGTGLIPIGGFRLNVTNRASADAWRARGVCDLILSPELTLPMMRDIGGAAIVYGRIPLMITERCFIKEGAGCERCDRFGLTDRIGKRFPILREYAHRNLILNAVPTYMGDRRAELRTHRLRGEHFIFTTEGVGEVVRLMTLYEAGGTPNGEVRRIKK